MLCVHVYTLRYVYYILRYVYYILRNTCYMLRGICGHARYIHRGICTRARYMWRGIITSHVMAVSHLFISIFTAVVVTIIFVAAGECREVLPKIHSTYVLDIIK